ncbi:hypothetical protein D3C75_439600 [compost metagenome]
MSMLKDVLSVVCVVEDNEVLLMEGWNKLGDDEKLSFKEGKKFEVVVGYNDDESMVEVKNLVDIEKFVEKELFEDDVMSELVKGDELKECVYWLYSNLNEYLMMGMDINGKYEIVVWDCEYVRGVSLYVKFDMYMDEEMLKSVEVYDDLV